MSLDATAPGRPDDVLLRLAQELHTAAVAAGRRDVAAKADDIRSLLLRGAGTDRDPRRGTDTAAGAGETAQRILNGLGL